MGVIYLLVLLHRQSRAISYNIYLLVKSIAAHARLKLAVLPRVQPCFLYTNKLVCGSGTAPEWVGLRAILCMPNLGKDRGFS